MSATITYSRVAASPANQPCWGPTSVPAKSIFTPLSPVAPAFNPPTRPVLNRQGLTLDQAQPGTVAFFTWDLVETNSMLNQQPQVTRSVGNHPVVIAALKDDGKISCCLPATSFGETTIQARYKGRRDQQKIFQQYVAIQQGQTIQHNDLPVLNLNSNGNRNIVMPKQSYVGMDGYFEIETKYLTQFCHGTRKLTEGSLNILLATYKNFCGR